MLLTRMHWEERQAARRRMVSPNIAWHRVALSSLGPCFLIECERESLDDSIFLSAYLVPSAEDLVETLEELEPGRCRVYRLRLSADEGVDSQLEPIHAVYSYLAAQAPWYSYVDANGVTRPCQNWQPETDIGTTFEIKWSVDHSVESVASVPGPRSSPA
jgi:hypothetical protein